MTARGAAIALGLALATGCALDAGHPFGVLDARLEAALVVAEGRDAGGGWQRLDNDFQVRIDRLELHAEPAELIDVGGPAAGFDPANPPPGYSLCHGGHCHADDGRLVSYEEIAAELAGGGGPRAVVALPVGAIDVAAGTARALPCVPGCDLPRASIGLVRMPVVRLEAEGVVRDRRDPARIAGEVPWAVSLDLAAEPVNLFAQDIDLPVDRSHPPVIELTLELAATAALFDGLPWDALPAQGGVLELDRDPEAAHHIADALGEHTLTARAERGDL